MLLNFHVGPVGQGEEEGDQGNDGLVKGREEDRSLHC